MLGPNATPGQSPQGQDPEVCTAGHGGESKSFADVETLGPVFPKLLTEQKGAEGEKNIVWEIKNVYREKLQELWLISLAEWHWAPSLC